MNESAVWKLLRQELNFIMEPGAGEDEYALHDRWSRRVIALVQIIEREGARVYANG